MIFHLLKKKKNKSVDKITPNPDLEESQNIEDKKEKKKKTKRQKEAKPERTSSIVNKYSFFYLLVISIVLTYMAISIPYSHFFADEYTFNVKSEVLAKSEYILLKYDFQTVDSELVPFKCNEGKNVYLTFKQNKDVFVLNNIYDKKPKTFYIKGVVSSIDKEKNVIHLNLELPKYIKTNFLLIFNKSDYTNIKKVTIRKSMGSYKVVEAQ